MTPLFMMLGSLFVLFLLLVLRGAFGLAFLLRFGLLLLALFLCRLPFLLALFGGFAALFLPFLVFLNARRRRGLACFLCVHRGCGLRRFLLFRGRDIALGHCADD